MKKNITIIFAFMLAFFFAGNVSAQDKQVIKEQKIKVEFHCPNGKALIEKELIKYDGIKEVVADLETKIVTVKFVEGQTNKERIVAAIEKIGYKTEFSKEGAVINKACTHDQPNSEGQKTESNPQK
jgi:copper chaperone CopZ